jgi:hypothetical protein
MQSPYVMVGGRLVAEGQGAEFSVSFDGKTWEAVDASAFDKKFAFSNGKGKYSYQLRCQLSGAATLKSLSIANDLQMAPLLLPEMGVGKNAFTYTDESASRKVRITHEWVERSASKPPAVPAAVYPPDKGDAVGSDVVFKWTPPSDPDGDKITDYHFELSNRADLKWPLSMSFVKLISRTADAGKAQYTLPRRGCSRATRSTTGTSRRRTRRASGALERDVELHHEGANYPVDVTLESGVLRWKPNPRARSPRSTGLRQRREGLLGERPAVHCLDRQQTELKNPFPANFVAETKGTELPVSGRPTIGWWRSTRRASGAVPRITSTRRGRRSAASRSWPRRRARLPVPVLANRSLGHLTIRQVGGRPGGQLLGRREAPVRLAKGPDWLKIDAATGPVGGTPPAAGRSRSR